MKVSDGIHKELQRTESSVIQSGTSSEMDDLSDMDTWLMGGVDHSGEVKDPISWILRDSEMNLQALISQSMQVQLSGNYTS